MMVICECKTCGTKIYELQPMASLEIALPELITIVFNFNKKHQNHDTVIRTDSLMLSWKEL
jgi:hypothetical protein